MKFLTQLLIVLLALSLIESYTPNPDGPIRWPKWPRPFPWPPRRWPPIKWPPIKLPQISLDKLRLQDIIKRKLHANPHKRSLKALKNHYAQ